MTTKTEVKNMKGSIGIPKEYFLKMAMADYNNYSEALAREFLQNSIDASAKKIDVKLEGEWLVISDDGCGMDLDTILNKLLVLGGSKKSAGSVGAFGKAKELLYFSWDKYEILTGHNLVIGAGAEFEISEVSDYTIGMTAKIQVLDSTVRIALLNAFHYIGSKMQVQVEITVAGQKVVCELKRGASVKDLEWAKIHQLKNRDDSHVHFRINGIWMFSRYIGHVEKMGTLVVELTKDSVECLTSNRDGLKAEYREQADAFLRKVLVDTQSALKPKHHIVRKMLPGAGSVSVVNSNDLDKIEFSDTVEIGLKELQAALEMGLGGAVKKGVIGYRIANEIQALGEMSTSEILEKFEDRFTFMGYQPDFVLKFDEITQNSLVEKHKKSRIANILAKSWTEIIKQVMLDNGIYENFVAGFTYDEEEEASYEMLNGKHTFYLNPLKVLANLKMEKTPLKRKTWAARDMLTKAIHEIAHMYHGDHNESFVLKMHSLNAHTYDSMVVYYATLKVNEKTSILV
jgi:hypothetical protein